MFTDLLQGGIVLLAIIRTPGQLNIPHRSPTGSYVLLVTRTARKNGHERSIGMARLQQENAPSVIIPMPPTIFSGSRNPYGTSVSHAMWRRHRAGMLLPHLYLAVEDILLKAFPIRPGLEGNSPVRAVITLMPQTQGSFLPMTCLVPIACARCVIKSKAHQIIVWKKCFVVIPAVFRRESSIS